MSDKLREAVLTNSIHCLEIFLHFLFLTQFAENATQAGILQQCVMHMDMYTAVQPRPDVMLNAAS